MSSDAESVSYEEIKGTVASLLFLFAEIEREVRAIILKARGEDGLIGVHGAGGALNAWRNLLLTAEATRPHEARLAERLWTQLQDPLAVRNGVCHGLIGASASRGGASATLTWRGKVDTCTRTYDELQEMFAWLSRLPRAISMISHVVLEKDPGKLRPLPHREFWASEFGIIQE